MMTLKDWEALVEFDEETFNQLSVELLSAAFKCILLAS